MTNTLYAGKANSPPTTLVTPISAVETSATLTDSTVLPDAPNICTFGTGEDAETVIYTGNAANVISGMTRQIEGTQKAWGAGTVVSRQFCNYDFKALSDLAAISSTWTPVLKFGAGTNNDVTYSAQSGYYVKIGPMVWYSGSFTLTSVGTDTGAALITGLPFPVAVVGAAGSCTLQTITFADTPQIFVSIATPTSITIQECTNAGVVTPLTNADFAIGSTMRFSVLIRV